jgi:hypothetical protein
MITIKSEHKVEAVNWCLDNLSTEGTRWWISYKQEWDNGSGTNCYKHVPVINFDVTEEEESTVLFFMLKYA